MAIFAGYILLKTGAVSCPALTHSDEGVSISVRGLPGCWSQGRDENEALENIQDAIREYLAVAEQQLQGADIREVEVTL